MTDSKIRELVYRFRSAIEVAYKDGKLSSDIIFKRFPHGCCGDTCYLLAEYLKSYGIETIWYSAERGEWSHAWLVVKDKRVKEPSQRFNFWPREVWDVLKEYGVDHPEAPIDVTKYNETDLSNGLIIDITADQFEDFDEPVYVGGLDYFHNSFVFVQAHDYEGLGDGRLHHLYMTITSYLRALQ